MSRAIAGRTTAGTRSNNFNDKAASIGLSNELDAVAQLDAVLLVTHGSRDPRSAQGASALAQALQRHRDSSSGQSDPSQSDPSRSDPGRSDPGPSSSSQLNSGPSKPSQAITIGTAALELGPAPLHQQILDFARQCDLAPGSCLNLLPLFLLPGVHVMEDIPQEVDAARKAMAQDPQLCQIRLRLLPYLGQHQQAMAQLLASSTSGASTPEASAQILMAHGSRRAGANPHIEVLGDRLNIPVAYWVQPESLTERVKALLQRNTGPVLAASLGASLGESSGDPSSPLTIEIIPYFLFEGGITDAIAQRLQDLENQLRPDFPQLCLKLGPTLHQRPGFETLVQAQIRQASSLDSN